MSASTKPAKRRPESRNEEPAKGGINPPRDKTHPSGDSPKPHGDAMQHAVDEATGRKDTK